MSYGPPPGPPVGPVSGPPPGRPAPQRPSKAPLLAGAFAGAVGPWFFTLVPLVLTGGANGAYYGLYAWVLVPVIGVALLLAPPTRRWGAGVLIGFFGMLVIGAGACLALVVGFNGNGTSP